MSHSFSIPNAAVAQDTSAHTHALALEAALSGPDHMAARVGTCAHASLIAAQLLRVREAWPDIWSRTGRVQVASSFLASLICGAFVSMGEAEACSTGLWSHAGSNAATGSQSHWDEGVLEIVGGNREEGRRIYGWLGDVDTSGGRRRLGTVSRYLTDRFGFDPGREFSDTSFGDMCPILIFYSVRNYCHAFHFRLPLCIPLRMPIPIRCRPFVRSYGCLDDTRSSLSSYPPIPHLSSPRPGLYREATLCCYAHEQVR